MKLPDFTNDAALNELRLKMGAELRPYSPPKGRAPLTADEVEALATKGIEIPLREIGILNDGTFTYKGKRVAVYIRDIASYHSDYSLPKYHLAMCETLLTMKGEGRYENDTSLPQGTMGVLEFKKSKAIALSVELMKNS